MLFTIDSDITDTSLNNQVNFTNFKAYIASKPNAFNAPLQHKGQVIVDEANKYGLSAIWVLAHACHESAFGTSWFAINRNNFFGIDAIDSDPNQADGYPTPEACISYYCRWFKSFYMTPGTWVYNGKTPRGANVHYASDKNWANAIVSIMNDFVKTAQINTSPVEVPNTNLNTIDDMTDVWVPDVVDTVFWRINGKKYTESERIFWENICKTQGVYEFIKQITDDQQYKARIQKADSYDSAIQEKDLALQAKDKSVDDLSKQLEEADQKLTNASQDLETKGQAIQTLTTQLEQANDTILSLKNQPNPLSILWTKIISILSKKSTKKD